MSTTAKKKHVGRILIHIGDNASNVLRLDQSGVIEGGEIAHDLDEINLVKNLREDYFELSFGCKLAAVMNAGNLEIPSQINVRISLSRKMAQLTNVQKYLMKAAQTSDCILTKFDKCDNVTGDMIAEFSGSNARRLIGALIASIKNNSAALGLSGELLNIDAAKDGDLIEYCAEYNELNKAC